MKQTQSEKGVLSIESLIYDTALGPLPPADWIPFSFLGPGTLSVPAPRSIGVHRIDVLPTLNHLISVQFLRQKGDHIGLYFVVYELLCTGAGALLDPIHVIICFLLSCRVERAAERGVVCGYIQIDGVLYLIFQARFDINAHLFQSKNWSFLGIFRHSYTHLSLLGDADCLAPLVRPLPIKVIVGLSFGLVVLAHEIGLKVYPVDFWFVYYLRNLLV